MAEVRATRLPSKMMEAQNSSPTDFELNPDAELGWNSNLEPKPLFPNNDTLLHWLKLESE